MKHFTLKSTIVAISLLSAVHANAQYITEAPAGGFDFSKGKDYVIIYTPEAQVTAMGTKVLSNQNLDPDMVKNQFYYWVADWDKTLFTLYDCPNDAKNSWGGDDKLNMTPLYNWGSGQFTAKSQAYDLSAIDNEHILHIGFMNIGGEGKSAKFQFSLGPGDASTNGFKLEANVAVGKGNGKFVGIGEATARNQWYYLDIPVSTLVDEDGDFGFEYNFKTPFAQQPIFTCGFDVDDASCTKFTTGSVDPDTGMKKITITQIGSAMAIDHVFLYKKDNTSGIEGVQSASGEDIQAVYDLSGRRADMSRPGIYVVKTANGVKKVAVK